MGAGGTDRARKKPAVVPHPVWDAAEIIRRAVDVDDLPGWPFYSG